MLTEVTEFDACDDRILGELQRDARITMAELGRRVHLSQPAVTERVRKLETSGVIKGYRAEVDLTRLGYGIRAIIRVARAEYARVVKLIEQTPEVLNAYNVTGEDSWVLEIAVIDVRHLDVVVSKFCILSPTSTSIVLNAPRENALVLPARREPPPLSSSSTTKATPK
ncbi:Lrp/AsnC family transcriptional regulator [Rhodoferax sp.]|uniref:Lrp/AsnC family transcriptional regulator n=1 Tax=Rhodoferax sp. TaxID=50421 RepID=UPI0025D8CFDA|nr:Lrp/AsnC family transcriptional regulator [Rhodoferax sp.]